MGTFANPAVDADTKVFILSELRDTPTFKPYNVVNTAVKNGFDEREARKLIRKLRLQNRITPVLDAAGEYEYHESTP